MAVARLHRDRGRGRRRCAGDCRVVEGAPTPFGGTWSVVRTPWGRLRGLAGRPPDETVAYFPHCRDVHTMTMDVPLDILFADARGRVLEVHRGVRPRTRLRNGRSHGVVERFARPGPWFQRGDYLASRRISDGDGRKPAPCRAASVAESHRASVSAAGTVPPVFKAPAEPKGCSDDTAVVRRKRLHETLPHV